MPDILAFTIFVLIFTIGEYVAAKTKANVDVVLFVSAALLVAFWIVLKFFKWNDSKKNLPLYQRAKI